MNVTGSGESSGTNMVGGSSEDKDKEIKDALMWAERITQNKQLGAQKKKDTVSNLKMAIYIMAIIAIIGIVCYIVYRAYRIPDPPSILQEVNNMINHIEAK